MPFRIPKDLPQVLPTPFPGPSTSLGCLSEMLFISCSPPKLPSVSTWDWLLISRDVTPYEGHNRHRPQTTSAVQRSSVLCAWARHLTSAGLSLLYCVSPRSQRRLCPPHSLRASLQLLALSGRLPATFTNDSPHQEDSGMWLAQW